MSVASVILLPAATPTVTAAAATTAVRPVWAFARALRTQQTPRVGSRKFRLENHDPVTAEPLAQPRPVVELGSGPSSASASTVDPLRAEPRENGGLPDEPLATFDVVLPGRFPHSLLGATDRRGIRGAYSAWVHDGAVRRVRE